MKTPMQENETEMQIKYHKYKCQICGKMTEDLEILETPNMKFELCLECAIEVESKIEDMLNYYKSGEKI